MLIACDAKALEWKTLLEMSRDPVGLEELAQGLDLHTENQKYFDLPSRLISKKYLFRTIYNRGKGFAFTVDPDFMGVSTSVQFWDDIGVKFYKKYAGINQLHFKWKEDLENQGFIESPLGRQHHLPLLNKYGMIDWNTFTNHPNQGLGADVMTIARISAHNRIKARGWDVKAVQTVHDSIVYDVHDKHIQQMVNLFHEVFKDIQPNIKKLFNYEWVVPLECEVKVGPNQKDMKEMKPAY